MGLPAISLNYTIKGRIKQFFCKQHIYNTLSNFYGDAILDVSAGRRKIVRSLLYCTKCGKLQPSEFLDKNCPIVNLNFKYDNGSLRSMEDENYKTLDRS